MKFLILRGEMRKKGLSPVIATVLLISIVIVIGLIVFLWFRGMTEEAITKFDGTNVKLVCEEVGFEADYDSGYLYISNLKDIPIYKIKVKISKDGEYSTTLLEENWPESGLLQAQGYSGTLEDVSAGDKILLIPVLIGETSDGEAAYTCDDRHGIELVA